MRTSRVPTASAPGARAASEWAAAALKGPCSAASRAEAVRDTPAPVAPEGDGGSTSAADHVR
ncbi:hypothetical protein [Umezawaea sp. Da 62-37]|uniref:hypothetical protein n=1 Tax=Umezawaea sp. Da 62-37 TaxID=3075927 RepID=UPI0028F6D999|nr:hypothetical protein [Umezawaea sp. Da 62-37]WNV89363.1 hypothetical protein RM788_13980 [Umezawaea sp. Da 62-37]